MAFTIELNITAGKRTVNKEIYFLNKNLMLELPSSSTTYGFFSAERIIRYPLIIKKPSTAILPFIKSPVPR